MTTLQDAELAEEMMQKMCELKTYVLENWLTTDEEVLETVMEHIKNLDKYANQKQNRARLLALGRQHGYATLWDGLLGITKVTWYASFVNGKKDAEQTGLNRVYEIIDHAMSSRLGESANGTMNLVLDEMAKDLKAVVMRAVRDGVLHRPWRLSFNVGGEWFVFNADGDDIFGDYVEYAMGDAEAKNGTRLVDVEVFGSNTFKNTLDELHGSDEDENGDALTVLDVMKMTQNKARFYVKGRAYGF
jgi:hypothetical protein